MNMAKVVGLASGFVAALAIFPAQALAASDPVKNGLTVLIGWVGYGLTIAGVVLLLVHWRSRKFGELIGGVALILIAFSLISSPDTWKQAGDNLVATLFK